MNHEEDFLYEEVPENVSVSEIPKTFVPVLVFFNWNFPGEVQHCIDSSGNITCLATDAIGIFLSTPGCWEA